jgi:hypothetical protein
MISMIFSKRNLNQIVEDYRPLVEKRFAFPSDTENYAGRSVSSY